MNLNSLIENLSPLARNAVLQRQQDLDLTLKQIQLRILEGEDYPGDWRNCGTKTANELLKWAGCEEGLRCTKCHQVLKNKS